MNIDLKALLTGLVNVVVEEAERNEAFKKNLEYVLFSAMGIEAGTNPLVERYQRLGEDAFKAELSKASKDELKEEAKKLGIKFTSRTTKANLVQLIIDFCKKNATAQAGTEEPSEMTSGKEAGEGETKTEQEKEEPGQAQTTEAETNDKDEQAQSTEAGSNAKGEQAQSSEADSNDKDEQAQSSEADASDKEEQAQSSEADASDKEEQAQSSEADASDKEEQAQSSEADASDKEEQAQSSEADASAAKEQAQAGQTPPPSHPPLSEIDPILIYAHEGPEKLREILETLDVKELHTLIKLHGMDPHSITTRWKKAERLRAHILSNAEVRATKGDSFRHYQG